MLTNGIHLDRLAVAFNITGSISLSPFLNPDRILPMKIRSITCFVNPQYPLKVRSLKAAGDFISMARPAFEQAGYEVQSTRLATIPFPGLLPELAAVELARLAQELERASADLGYGYLSMGPALPELPESFGLIPEALAATQNTFFSALMTTDRGMVSLPAVRSCAQVIQQASQISADGFANLRFAALANVPAGSPFFPAAYHQGEKPSFALATEAADLALTAFDCASSLQEGRDNLIRAVEAHAQVLTDVGWALEGRSGVKFAGIDFSPAPFPAKELSVGTALERLGVQGFGSQGSLAATAILADTIDRAKFSRAGFSGVMLPVLEDAVLAERVREGALGITDLLLYSAVCGTGLDTIPLPGDTSVEALSAILLDVSALALRLDKPLTARLMPIPGKSAGDLTGFDFAYFANSRVLPVRASPLGELLSGDESFDLNRYERHESI
ncbi:MAG: DUF711 family protein [Acidobacteriaceae bacterium]